MKLVWIYNVEFLMEFFSILFHKRFFLIPFYPLRIGKQQIWKPRRCHTNSELTWKLQSFMVFNSFPQARI